MADKHDKPFLTDVKTLRARARQRIEQGAVTLGYKADRDTVIDLLNAALATEIVCVLRYKRHHYMASGINAQSVAAEFLQHAVEEQVHADEIASRIVQLGGEPDFAPEGLVSRAHSEYVAGDTLVEMIKEDLIAERIAIDSYGEIIRYLGHDDPTTTRMLEGILAMEEEHAEDLSTLLANMQKSAGARQSVKNSAVRAVAKSAPKPAPRELAASKSLALKPTARKAAKRAPRR